MLICWIISRWYHLIVVSVKIGSSLTGISHFSCTYRKLELSFMSGSSEGQGFYLPEPESYSRVITSAGLLMRQHMMITHSLWCSSFAPTKNPFYTTWFRVWCLHIILPSLIWPSWEAEKIEQEGDFYLAAHVLHSMPRLQHYNLTHYYIY